MILAIVLSASVSMLVTSGVLRYFCLKTIDADAAKLIRQGWMACEDSIIEGGEGAYHLLLTREAKGLRRGSDEAEDNARHHAIIQRLRRDELRK